ncbi:deaminase [Archangium sp.]|uniref:deaminase n=1 Tax=Archangium sp. TaxID=1872627 RepID=UPI002D47A638|nr:deaminase [Archangium sp.]HYO58156.1 deaminase [Archangium sp.]
MHCRNAGAIAACLLLLFSSIPPPVLAGDKAGQTTALQKKRKATRKTSNAVKGRVTVPYVVLHPGTDRQVVWFASEEGPQATGEEVSAEEVQSFLARLATARAHEPEGVRLGGTLESAAHLEAWERHLWREYLEHMGGQGAALRAFRADLRPTAEDRRDMALRVALGALWPGMGEGVAATLTLENVVSGAGASITAFLVLAAIPEPFSKPVAIGVALTVVAAFGAKLLVHVVEEWRQLTKATAVARSFTEVREAGERFGRALGADGARLLMMVASLWAGGSMGTSLKGGGPGWPGLGRMMELPGGLRVSLSQVQSISLAGDRLVVAMTAASGTGATAAGVAGTGGENRASGTSESQAAATTTDTNGAASGLDDLARLRNELGLQHGEGTLTRLDVGGRSFYGINAHGQTVSLKTNVITATHAEADAFQQAAKAGVNGGRGRLYVDRDLCRACGPSGGVRGLARQLGLEELEVVTPSGIQIIRP